MNKRKIIIHPQKNYYFKPNSAYKNEWNFLPDPDRIAIIGTQLTYLDFHGWLHHNIRTTDDPRSEPSSYTKLQFDVSEGFIRTDILLYAAICETAIYTAVKHAYDNKSDSTPQSVINCFEAIEKKPVQISNELFMRKINRNPEYVRIGYMT